MSTAAVAAVRVITLVLYQVLRWRTARAGYLVAGLLAFDQARQLDLQGRS